MNIAKFKEGDRITVVPEDHAFAGRKGVVLGVVAEGDFVRCRLYGDEGISTVLIAPQSLAVTGQTEAA